MLVVSIFMPDAFLLPRYLPRSARVTMQRLPPPRLLLPSAVFRQRRLRAIFTRAMPVSFFTRCCADGAHLRRSVYGVLYTKRESDHD